jgi:Transposase Tn5 dimerisation domain/Transposase DNA-binding
MTPSAPPTSCSIEDEFATIDLGDKRLNRRAALIISTLFSNSDSSIPKAFKGMGETQAAYRFFDNEKVTWDKIMAAHWACAEQRAKFQAIVLALQDTTVLDFNGQQIRGLGSLSYPTQRGMYLHATLMITPERESLGVVDAWMYTRSLSDEQLAKLPPVPVTKKSEKRKAKAAQQQSGNNATAIETVTVPEPKCKESVRWIEGYDRIADMAERLGPATQVVYIADREGDILALMERAQARGNQADFLVRAKHNRKLHEGEMLWDSVAATEPLGLVNFNLVAKKGVKARTITQEIRVKHVLLGKGGKIPATCIIATEVGAPPDTEPVCWRLLTNRSVTTLEQAIELIGWYRARWEIEIFFHVLKNGCTVEKMQLDTIEKVQNALAIYMIVAWRIMYLMRMGRTCPALPADLIFEPDEIRTVYLLREKEPPKDRLPKINEVLRMVAQIGGFLARKGDGEPGVQTIWRGIQEVRVAVTTIQILRKLGHLKPGEFDQTRLAETCV